MNIDIPRSQPSHEIPGISSYNCSFTVVHNGNMSLTVILMVDLGLTVLCSTVEEDQRDNQVSTKSRVWTRVD